MYSKDKTTAAITESSGLSLSPLIIPHFVHAYFYIASAKHLWNSHAALKQERLVRLVPERGAMSKGAKMDLV